MSEPISAGRTTTVDTFQGVCYADGVATPPPPEGAAASDPPPRDFVDDCAGGMPHWYCAANGGDPYAAPAPWNGDAGPTRQVHGEDAEARRKRCSKEARANADDCLKAQAYNAQLLCENTPTRAGVDVDMRPIEPGQEKACQDHWLHGTDGHSVNDIGTDGKHTSDARATATQVGGKMTGGFKVKVGDAEASLGGETSQQTTDTDQHTTGTLRFDAHSEGHTRAARPGTAEKCDAHLREQLEKCAAER
jgi:hypothetical protein